MLGWLIDTVSGNDNWRVPPMYGRYVDYVQATQQGIAPPSKLNTSREAEARRQREKQG